MDGSVKITSNTVVYAAFKKKEISTITFDANSGAGAMDSVSIDKGSSYTLPVSKFTRATSIMNGMMLKGSISPPIMDRTPPKTDPITPESPFMAPIPPTAFTRSSSDSHWDTSYDCAAGRTQ